MGPDRRLSGVVWWLVLRLLLTTSKATAAAYGLPQSGIVTYYSSVQSPAKAPPSQAPPSVTLPSRTPPSLAPLSATLPAKAPSRAPSRAPSPPAPTPGSAPAVAPAPLPGGALISGACGYGVLTDQQWPYNNVVALGPNNSIVANIGANKLGCGECIRATCTSANCAANSSAGVLLWITDGCGGCAPNQLNVPEDTFLAHFGSTLGLGQVNVTYQQVDCDPPGNIEVKVIASQPENGGYIAIALLSVAGSGMISGVDIKTSGSLTWAPMENGYGNVWQAGSIGAPPLDLRITSFQGMVAIALKAITNITNGVFTTSAQFSLAAPSTAPAPAPLVLPRAAPRPSLGVSLAPQPSTSPSPPPLTLAIGARITVPLYYAPADVTTLGTYAGLIWSYVECFQGTPILNLTVARMSVPNANGNVFPAYALHSFHYRIVRTRATTPVYQIMDYSFFNLETGEIAQLYEPFFINFNNASYTGRVPVVNLETQETIFPVFVTSIDLSGPGSFPYTILLPPGPNQDPTQAYLRAMKTMFYFLSTLTLGNPGLGEYYIPCSPGYPQMGPWADYLRGIISALAPSDLIQGTLYENIPLGSGYAFEDTSFVINNAIIVGRIMNTTNELSSKDCSSKCRATATRALSTGLCSAWSWCGSISGCGTASYQTCQLKNSSAATNTTSSSGFLNLQLNSSFRFTSGSLILPPPTGINFSNTAVNYSGGASGGLTTSSALVSSSSPALSPG